MRGYELQADLNFRKLKNIAVNKEKRYGRMEEIGVGNE